MYVHQLDSWLGETPTVRYVVLFAGLSATMFPRIAAAPTGASQGETLRIGMSREQVRATVGPPQWEVPDLTVAAGRRGDSAVYKYGGASQQSIATKGTVYFNAEGRVSAVFGFNGSTTLPDLTLSEREEILDIIDESPGVCGVAFRSRRLVRAANALLAKGKDFVVRAIEEYLRLAPRVYRFSKWFLTEPPIFLGKPKKGRPRLPRCSSPMVPFSARKKPRHTRSVQRAAFQVVGPRGVTGPDNRDAAPDHRWGARGLLRAPLVGCSGLRREAA